MALGNIDTAQGDKLLSRLGSQGAGIDSHPLINQIQQNIADGDSIDSVRLQIDNNAGTNLTFSMAGELHNMVNEYASSESVLNSNTSKRARSYMTESMKITGIMGNLTPEGAKKTAASVREFDTRVLAGEDPFAVADDLYDRDTLIKVESTGSRLGYDTKNLDAAIAKLKADNVEAHNNAKDDVAKNNIRTKYNRDLNILQTIQTLQRSQEEFNKSLKGLPK